MSKDTMLPCKGSLHTDITLVGLKIKIKQKRK